MKTTTKKFLILTCLMISVSAYGQGFLRADGKKIVDGAGRQIILRGMGLGGWMLQEPYMLQLSGIADNQTQIRAKLEKLAGKENTAQFYEAWLANFITKADIDSMAAWGFNSVRLPMHYNLYTLPVAEEKDSTQNTWLTKGFALTDSLLAWCKANRIYLILDLHAAPGGQGTDMPISDRNAGKPSLWQSEANRNKTVALWTELAKRYVNEEWIGGYDLINETNWGFTDPKDKNGCDEKSNAELKALLMDITAAIRNIDKQHLIFIEGNCWANNYNGMFPLWDNNMVVSFHKYWNNNDHASIEKFLQISDRYNVPLWMGESGENSNVWFTDAISLLEKYHIGWAWWPLKKLGRNNPLQIREPAGYRQLVQCMREGKNTITKEKAFATMMELATASHIENNLVHADVIDAMFRQVRTAETIPYSNHALKKQLRIFATDYDRGRINHAYFDADAGNYWVSNNKRTAWNHGGQYRNDGVDIGACTDSVSNGYHVGWTKAGEWLQYTINVAEKGLYNVRIRVKNGNGQRGVIGLMVNGKTITYEVLSQNKPSGKWKTTALKQVWLNEGDNKLRLMIVKGGVDLNYLEIEKAAATGHLETR